MSGQETQTQMFSCGVCEIFKNWSLRTTDSETCCFTWSVLLYKLYLWLKLVLGPANIRLDEDVLKMSFVFVFRRRLDQDEYVRLSLTSSEDVFKTSWSKPIYSSWPYVFKTSSRRFQHVFKTSCKSVFKTSSRRLPKMSSKRFWDVS